jgi:hypothetical protein
MTRSKTWHAFYPEEQLTNLDKAWYEFQKFLECTKRSWYYPYLPSNIYKLIELADTLRYEAGSYGHQAQLRYKVAVLTSELKTYKENATKAREVKEKYNKLRRERSTNAKSKKP